ncbi:MAG: M43 family zinc metalloprotease [Flavobacteriales bacterium]|nr:M43 family zinc metalloprotease [Flavobacteriales bacterium]
MKNLITCVFCFFIGVSSISAQNWCGTVEHQQSLIENQPEKAALLQEKMDQFNRLQRENLKKGIKNNDDHIVPVVFHVIHEGGSENISYAQIEDQMRILNEDFARLNPDTTNTPAIFAQNSGDTNIEFRLAKIDPDGNCTQGVTRTYSNLTNGARNNVKELIQWDPTRYMNVWVVKTIENFSDDGNIVLGFAQFPTDINSDPETDGIVLRHNYCGSIESASSNYGRTLTHEAGHWLNLVHIWGDQDCGDDNVDDTPTGQEPNYGVCTNNFPYHVGVCSESNGQTITQSSGEMFMNYMDYSDDFCMNMFSLGQGSRMRSAISQYRNLLTSESNLIATGTNDDHVMVECEPITEFEADFAFGCKGDGIEFESKTYNTSLSSITGYEWAFEGGSPSSSTNENPSVTYMQPGTYDVTLTVTNSAGSNTLTKSNYITISSLNAEMTGPYFQNFESEGFPTFENSPASSWTISGNITDSWERATNASSPNLSPIDNGNNSASFRVRSLEFIDAGETHTLMTPGIDLSDLDAPVRAYFDLAYAKRSGNTSDILEVHVSDDCGRTWSKRWDRECNEDTDDLSTNGGGNVVFPYTPSSAHWEQQNVNINNYAGRSNVSLKFVFSGSGGNWLYIDNFVVCETSQLSLNKDSFSDLNIFPNPSKGDATIEFSLYKDSKIEIALSNLYGAVLAQERMDLKAELNSIQLKDLYSSLKAGVYFIKITQDGVSATKKVVISE